MTKMKHVEQVSKAGFTLIEIMVVVIIIGILAGLAAVKVGNRVGQSQEAGARANIKTLGMAIALYEVDNGSLPPNLEALVSKTGAANNWRGPYLESGLPKDPWGNAFQYQIDGNSGTYKLKSMGADGMVSGDDITKGSGVN